MYTDHFSFLFFLFFKLFEMKIVTFFLFVLGGFLVFFVLFCFPAVATLKRSRNNNNKKIFFK